MVPCMIKAYLKSGLGVGSGGKAGQTSGDDGVAGDTHQSLGTGSSQLLQGQHRQEEGLIARKGVCMTAAWRLESALTERRSYHW